MDRQISDLIKPFALKPEWADQMLAKLKKEADDQKSASSKLIFSKRAEIEKLKARNQMLLDSLLDGVINRDEFTKERFQIMSEKKTLEEQCSSLFNGRAHWLEPFQRWVLTAKNAGEIAVSGSLTEKRGLALKIFGSNLVLDCKKARGSCVKPWSHLIENALGGGVVRAQGLEPWTIPV